MSFLQASGKSRIVEEDLNSYAKDILILEHLTLATKMVNIIEDWKTRIHSSLQKYKRPDRSTDLCLYGSSYNLQYSKDAYDYIVIDEAHHAVAPMLKRVIQYSQHLTL